jgi:tRNA threonylcarbamoyladenosine biosynthesis protein TsaB
MKKFQSKDNKITKTQPGITLALETSGRQGSVAIGKGYEMMGEKEFSAPMKHSAEIFPTIQNLLREHNLTPSQIKYCCVSVGPGSFTGLRIAVTIAKMMSLASQCKIVAVDTLDVIAANAVFDQKIQQQDIDTLAVILDAKRGKFFTGIYQRSKKPASEYNLLNNWEKLSEDKILSANQFNQKFADSEISVYLLGEGLVYYRGDFESDNIKVLDERYWRPKAANLYKLGIEKAKQQKFTPAAELVPEYIQNPDIRIPKI